MTPAQVELMRQAARTLLAHHDAGLKCEPHAAQWVRDVLGTVPLPKSEGRKA